jgi:hypothetical protein
MIMLGGPQGWFGEAPVGLATPPDSCIASRFRFHSLPGMTAVEAVGGDFRNVSSAVCGHGQGQGQGQGQGHPGLGINADSAAKTRQHWQAHVMNRAGQWRQRGRRMKRSPICVQ